MVPRILLLSADFGSGHLHAAEAIAQALLEQQPGCKVVTLNVENRILRLMSKTYLSMLRFAPSAYRGLYRAPVGDGMRRFIRAVLYHTVRQEIARLRPTAILATHPFPGTAAAFLRSEEKLQGSVAMAITDFVPHPFWVHAGVDSYFVASDKAARTLRTLGVGRTKIKVTGIPIRPEFSLCGSPALEQDRAAIRRVLVMGGGLGLGPIEEAVRSLAQIPHGNLHVTVVCGTNVLLQRSLTNRFGSDSRFDILGYTDRVPELMAQAHLLISKAGGLSCSEAMACGLPILLLRPLPGHEEENAAYLAETSAARVVDEAQVGKTVLELLFTASEKLTAMQDAARSAGHPVAARSIASELLSHVPDTGDAGIRGHLL